MSNKFFFALLALLCLCVPGISQTQKDGYDVRTRSGFFGMSEEDAKRLKPANGK